MKGIPSSISPESRRRNLNIAFENISASAGASSGPDIKAARASFKFRDLLEALRDIGALILILLFLGLTAAAIPAAIFILLFVGVR
jgi:hypothetical protein